MRRFGRVRKSRLNQLQKDSANSPGSILSDFIPATEADRNADSEFVKWLSSINASEWARCDQVRWLSCLGGSKPPKDIPAPPASPI